MFAHSLTWIPVWDLSTHADNHTYDDSRFYQKMLREVLQGGGGGGGLAGAGPGSLMAVDDPDEMSRQWLAMAKLKEARKSKKKKVDTRASKGLPSFF